MTSRKTAAAAPVQTLAWSRLNELLSVTTENGTNDIVESYRYDADGDRIYQQSATGSTVNWQEWDYFPHYEVRKVGGVETVTKYYFFNGQRFAQKVGSGVLTYLHSDHLGSTVLTTGVAGNRKYYAYGATRSGSVPTDYGFTSQQEDGGTGLIYLHARYYDPATGQFISPDTLVPNAADVLSYNRYLYARSNPVRYVDPSGHADCAAGDSDCWNSQWQWNNRWYNAHGYHWGGAHWSVAGDPIFADESILNDTVDEAGISWDTGPGDEGGWTFERKVKVANGIVRFGQTLSGGLARLNALLGGHATMWIATDGNWLCNRGRVPCSMPSWDHDIVWPTAYIDANYAYEQQVAATTVHELAHVIDWQSGREFSDWWRRNAALTDYGLGCAGNPCIARWERWADAVQVSVYGAQSLSLLEHVSPAEVSSQVDLVRGLLGGWVQP